MVARAKFWTPLHKILDPPLLGEFMCSIVGYLGVITLLSVYKLSIGSYGLLCVVIETILDYRTFYHLGIEKLTFEPISM